MQPTRPGSGWMSKYFTQTQSEGGKTEQNNFSLLLFCCICYRFHRNYSARLKMRHILAGELKTLLQTSYLAEEEDTPSLYLPSHSSPHSFGASTSLPPSPWKMSAGAHVGLLQRGNFCFRCDSIKPKSQIDSLLTATTRNDLQRTTTDFQKKPMHCFLNLGHNLPNFVKCTYGNVTRVTNSFANFS